MRLRFAIALVCALAAAGVAWLRPWEHAPHAGAVVAQSSLRPGGFMIVVRNDSGETLHIAQITVNDAFVGFHAGRLLLPPHRQTRVTVDYDWIAGEPYEIGILTSDGAILQSDVGGGEGA